MFGIGANELVLILLFGFIIFGPDKLPAMAKTIGQAIAKFRKAQSEMNEVIKNEVYDPNAEDPFKNPLDVLSKAEAKAKREDEGESFTVRKARYDRQREAKKAAEARRAKAEAESAAKQQAKEAGAAGAAATATKAASASASDEKSPQKATKISADELYGTTPKAKKPAQKKESTDASTGAAANASAPASAKAPAKAPAKPKAKPVVSTDPVEKKIASAEDDAVDVASSGKGE